MTKQKMIYELFPPFSTSLRSLPGSIDTEKQR